MDYEVVFEMATTGPGELGFVLPGVLFVAIGAALLALRKRLPSVAALPGRRLALCLLGFAVVWTLVAGLSIGAGQSALRADYAAGRFEVAEGVVEDFVPMLHGGRKESFTVDGRRFEYSDFFVTPGFNNAASRGGPIRPGLAVRVSHVGDVIVKLEVDRAAARASKR